MKEEQKMKELAWLWCRWNRKELSGEEFAFRVGELYKKEVLEFWNDPLAALLV